MLNIAVPLSSGTDWGYILKLLRIGINIKIIHKGNQNGLKISSIIFDELNEISIGTPK